MFQGDSDKSAGIQKKLEVLLEMAIEKEKKLTTGLNNFYTEAGKILDTVKLTLSEEVIPTDKISKFSWSPTLKGAKIKITDTIAEQTAT